MVIDDYSGNNARGVSLGYQSYASFPFGWTVGQK